MEENYRRYPIGIQNFEQLRNRNCVYVDKTELVYRLANTDSVYFLSRPRRFGKSLLVSTLEAYFQGKKDLFKGLAMERLEKDWNVYPVFHIDFSLTKYTTLFDLQEQLNLFLLRCEKVYGAEKEEKTPAARLQGMIRRAYEQTGLPVVVLIDEYDAPLLDSNSNIPLQQELRNELRKFFSPLKGLGQYLRFLFITGISKFSQMSIFSELNNLKNISMRDDFSAICGITERELLDELRPDIERMALANGETYEAACAHLKRQYDGYHFSKHCEDIYNPFSLFNAFDAKEYKNFWFSTGTPTFLIDILQQSDFDIRQLDGVSATAEQFDAPTNVITDPLPVLYQSGYLTIKEYNRRMGTYLLDFPNNEVRKGFLSVLAAHYLKPGGGEVNSWIIDAVTCLEQGNTSAFCDSLTAFLASIPYDSHASLKELDMTEKHFQYTFYLILRLIGVYCRAIHCENRQSFGRVDCILEMDEYVYIFEFKMDGTAEEALQQIAEKGYARSYLTDNRKIVCIGVNFSSLTRTVEEWKEIIYR